MKLHSNAALGPKDDQMTSKCVMQIQVAHSDRDALDGMITDLVDQRLIACGQVIGPISSTFFWEGSVQSADEWLAVDPEDVVHPVLLGGWWCQSPSPKEIPDEAAR